jgi:SSS family solute:Na+ symporter
MKYSIDTVIVLSYVVVVFIVGFIYSRRYSKESAADFLTGGHHLSWWQTGMTLIGMMFDPGIMGIAALGFVWGFYVIQWNGVNVWFTAWFAGMFFVGIYWRSKIVTTTEYLEKRFNVQTRAFFSLIMAFQLILLLAYAVYFGSVLLQEFLGWEKWFSVVLLSAVAGFYVIVGGMRTMLFMDIIQAILLLVALFVVGIVGFLMLGGLPGIKELAVAGKAGTPMNSLIPPLDFSLRSNVYFPLPAIPTFAVIAGLSWIICNFSMAQRLLAAKDESHAQKALIMAGVFNVFILFLSYAAGVAMKQLMPDLVPDRAYMQLIVSKFPMGVKGLLIAGLLAALFSTIDGLIASSSSLLTMDIYKRFFKQDATDNHLKTVTRIIEVFVVLAVFAFAPMFIKYGRSAPVYQLVQEFLGILLGVLIAIFILGIFFKRTTARACFISMVFGVVIGAVLQSGKFIGYGQEMGLISKDIKVFGGYTMNFAHIGTIQFLVVMILGYVLSLMEKPKTEAELANLTIWTLPDVKGPWIGLKSWPALWKWAIALPATWLIICLVWELYMRS